ncbi:hypothetical protein SERLA73DRAFT_150949 [Serpula lacrymans var. lacrymans S7.3]|uniref:Uncharacterized protein n=1 Tax=Serpula lacrymans var. lacrymans (strain S7.3) TaxID=936435 RepID=F8PP11_SERL3|nr:hypothetical protein SERLA73DRAFT_150949 [Serpula lacrymans var. lacrymans S7.3]
MHLVALNIPDLLINLWQKNIACDKTDDKSSWDWGVLCDEVWTQHGKMIENSTCYLPGSFDRPPRNPAEKISSGYKAWEFLLYIYGLAPGVLYGVLPEKYWKNFCKLVYSIHIFNQHKILLPDLQEAHKKILKFTAEFELLYYQRQTDRLHFIHPSIHTAHHLGPEVTQSGPGICSSQWTIKRTIGNLGQEMRQPSNPYANISQRGLLRSQINALKAMIPILNPERNSLLKGAKDVEGGYVLLRAKEKYPSNVRDCEVEVIRAYLLTMSTYNTAAVNEWNPMVVWWAQL